MGTTIEVGRLLLKDTWDISSISKEEKTDKYCIVKKKKKKNNIGRRIDSRFWMKSKVHL